MTKKQAPQKKADFLETSPPGAIKSFSFSLLKTLSEKGLHYSKVSRFSLERCFPSKKTKQVETEEKALRCKLLRCAKPDSSSAKAHEKACPTLSHLLSNHQQMLLFRIL